MENKKESNHKYLSPYDPDPKILYTFSSIKYLDTLKVWKLWFSPTKLYNDIHENTIFVRETEGNTSMGLDAEEQIKEWINSQVVRCFTTNPASPLMWAHYADSHTGVCVGFDLEKLTTKLHEGQPLRHYPIRYSTYPPLSTVTAPLTDSGVLHLARDIMLTKSVDWRYEQEHRVYTLNSGMVLEDGWLIDVGSDAVVDIIFGKNVPDEIIEEERSRSPDGIDIRRAEIDARALSYNLIIRTL